MATEGEQKMARLEAVVAKLEAHEKRLAGMLTQAPRPAAVSGGGVCFPNYGRSKGLPVAGASKGDLDFYRKGCERTLADPEKERFHARERLLLAAIDAELGNDAPPPSDADAPPESLPF